MADFFGEETDPFAPTGVKKAAGATPGLHTPGTAGAAGAPTQTPSGYVGPKTASGGATGNTAAQQQAFQSGNVGGASGAYNTGGAQTKAGYDNMGSAGDPGLFGSVTDLFNNVGARVGAPGAGEAIRQDFGVAPGSTAQAFDSMGQRVGVSNAGAPVASGWGGFEVKNPLDINPLAPVVDTQTGPGVVGQNAPIAAMSPDAAALVGGTTPGDALDQALNGAGGLGGDFDASGADRGGAARIDANMMAQRGQEAIARNPGGAGAQQQQDVLDQVMAFAQAPEGPSKANLLLQQANQGAMADILSAARSGRARDAGSQARAMNVAQGEIAGAGVDAARNAALLRQQEAQDFRNQQLSALGLGGDVSGAIRGAGIQERGQNLGLESDILGTIPALENVRHQDEFDLTPQQKLLAARLAGPREPTTADYVTGLLGDVLPVLGTAIGGKK